MGTETFRILEEAMAEEDVAALVVTPSLLMFIRLCVKVIARLGSESLEDSSRVGTETFRILEEAIEHTKNDEEVE